MSTWLASGFGVGTSFTSHFAFTAGTTAAFIGMAPFATFRSMKIGCRRPRPGSARSAGVPTGVGRGMNPPRDADVGAAPRGRPCARADRVGQWEGGHGGPPLHSLNPRFFGCQEGAPRGVPLALGPCRPESVDHAIGPEDELPDVLDP